MITVQGLTKRYGEKIAVQDLSFTIRSGMVTGFLGPNGAGKSTTMRMILGLDEPDSGSVTVNGKQYRNLTAPMCEVGALLEARAIQNGRSAYNHLLALAQTHGLPRRRVQEVIDMVGLREVARKRAGGFSLGMGQRLGIASALLGDPGTIILDEPVNGLDPEGVLWIRNLLKDLAAQGRTVFVSSHLMTEMALTAERLIVVGRGRLIADSTVEEFVARASLNTLRVRASDTARLRDLLADTDVSISSGQDGALDISGLTADRVGDTAAAHGIAIYELAAQTASLEEAFMEVTRDAVEYRPSSHAGRQTLGAQL